MAMAMIVPRLLNEARVGVNAVKAANCRGGISNSCETESERGNCRRGKQRLHDYLLEQFAQRATTLGTRLISRVHLVAAALAHPALCFVRRCEAKLDGGAPGTYPFVKSLSLKHQKADSRIIWLEIKKPRRDCRG
jgi:hypothetical protein